MESKSKKKLVRLLKDEKVRDPKTRWISLNKLWFEPESRQLFYEAVLEIWRSQLDISADSLILYPEGLASSFGLLPIVSLVTHKLGYRMAIWRELGDIITTTPRIFPDISTLPQGLNCTIFQDVVGKGTILRKMYPQILKMNWQVNRYIAVVQLADDQRGLDANIDYCKEILARDFQFLSMVKDSDVWR